MASREDLKAWVMDALITNGGSARVPEIAKYIWEHHEAELRGSGELFYTWQYSMRWAGQLLQKEGLIKKNGPGRTWEVK
jgi:hypothetical protein